MSEKIVWAVDLFEDPAVQKRILHGLELWTRGLPFVIQPAYVFAAHGHWPAVKESGAVDRDLEARFARFMAGGQSPPLAPLKVLRAKGSTLREKAGALLEYAEAEGAALIALTTRAKTGVSRWAFGSLAETLVLSSRLPLLTLNPEVRGLSSLDKILFPTDLSAESDRVLTIVVAEAARRGLGLTLAYCSQFDQAHSDAAYGPAAGYDEARAGYLSKKRAELSERVGIAKDRGLAADGILLEGKFDVAEAILEAAAERNANMIAMASHCGPVAAALGGSVTRRIIRAASCPVLAFHAAR